MERRPFLLPCGVVGAALAATAVVNLCVLEETRRSSKGYARLRRTGDADEEARAGVWRHRFCLPNVVHGPDDKRTIPVACS